MLRVLVRSRAETDRLLPTSVLLSKRAMVELALLEVTAAATLRWLRVSMSAFSCADRLRLLEVRVVVPETLPALVSVPCPSLSSTL